MVPPRATGPALEGSNQRGFQAGIFCDEIPDEIRVAENPNHLLRGLPVEALFQAPSNFLLQ